MKKLRFAAIVMTLAAVVVLMSAVLAAPTVSRGGPAEVAVGSSTQLNVTPGDAIQWYRSAKSDGSNPAAVGERNSATLTVTPELGSMFYFAEVDGEMSNIVKVSGYNDFHSYVYRFDTQTEIDDWQYANASDDAPATLMSENGMTYTHFKNFGYMRKLNVTDTVDIDALPYVSFKYRTDRPLTGRTSPNDQNNFYIATDKPGANSGLGWLLRLKAPYNPLTGDNQWHVKTVNITDVDDLNRQFGDPEAAVGGRLKSFALEWRLYEPQLFLDLEYFGFFSSAEAAEDYAEGANKIPDGSLFQLADDEAYTAVFLPEADYVDGQGAALEANTEYTAGLKSREKFDLATYSVAKVGYVNNSGKSAELRFIEGTTGEVLGTVTLPASASGSAIGDFTDLETWKGEFTDLVIESDADITLSYIGFLKTNHDAENYNGKAKLPQSGEEDVEYEDAVWWNFADTDLYHSLRVSGADKKIEAGTPNHVVLTATTNGYMSFVFNREDMKLEQRFTAEQFPFAAIGYKSAQLEGKNAYIKYITDRYETATRVNFTLNSLGEDANGYSKVVLDLSSMAAIKPAADGETINEFRGDVQSIEIGFEVEAGDVIEIPYIVFFYDDIQANLFDGNVLVPPAAPGDWVSKNVVKSDYLTLEDIDFSTDPVVIDLGDVTRISRIALNDMKKQYPEATVRVQGDGFYYEFATRDIYSDLETWYYDLEVFLDEGHEGDVYRDRIKQLAEQKGEYLGGAYFVQKFIQDRSMPFKGKLYFEVDSEYDDQYVEIYRYDPSKNQLVLTEYVLVKDCVLTVNTLGGDLAFVYTGEDPSEEQLRKDAAASIDCDVITFNSTEALSAWTYYGNNGDVVRDPNTMLPPLMTENGETFVRLSNLLYMTTNLPTPVDEYKHIMAFKFRSNNQVSRNAYIYTDYFRENQNGYEHQRSSALLRMLSLPSDGEWHTIIVDLSSIDDQIAQWGREGSNPVQGNIEALRLDWYSYSAENAYFDVAYVGFFASKADAQLYAGASDFMDGTVETDNAKVIVKPWSGVYTLTPEKKYVMSASESGNGDAVSVVHEDGTTDIIALSYNDGDKYVYIPNGIGQYIPSEYTKSFSDIDGHWAQDYINFTANRKLFDGTEEDVFSPEDTMTRGMFITVLGRMHGIKTADYTGESFKDVNVQEYYAPYIKWAMNNDIVSADDNGNFLPDEDISRIDMANIIAKYLRAFDYNLDGVGKMAEFDDLGNVDIHDIGAVYMMQRLGIIQGRTESTFEPEGVMTRGEVSTVFTRLVEAILGVLPAEDVGVMDYGSDPVIFKFDTVDDLTEWEYYGDVVRDPETGLPPIVTEDGQTFVHLENLGYMVDPLTAGFDTQVNHYMAFKYRSKRSIGANFYIYTDYFRIYQNGYEHSREGALLRVPNKIIGDGEWHTIIVDISSVEDLTDKLGREPSNAVQGIAERIRYDWNVASAEGEYLDLAYIGFFADKESAENFTEQDSEFWDARRNQAQEAELNPDDITPIYPYKENRLLIGAYDVTITTEEDVKLLAEAGLNFVQTDYANNIHRDNVLKWCYKYGIDVMFFTRGYTKPYENQVTRLYAGTAKMPNFIGGNIYDEPSATLYAGLAEMGDAFRAVDSNRYAMINLLPNYATSRQLEGYPEGVTDTAAYDRTNPATMSYREYLERFASEVAAENDVLSVDIYPLMWSGTTKTTRNNYIQGLSELGQVARDNNLRFSVILQAVNYASGIRQPDEQDGRYQAYASMLFGCDMMSYYTYRTRSYESGTGMVDREGVPSDTFYNLQPVNFELQRISDVFMQYKSLGAFCQNVIPLNMPGVTGRPDLYMLENYDDASVRPILDTQEPVVVGCFEKKEGKGNAYIILNGNDLNASDKVITVPVKFPVSGTVTAYPFGTAQVLTPNADGYYEITLECGQGVLVTVD